eukprot:gb/GFBE01020286.1/.p1 GENE.gb/GFBE01020286.1/~~gb/GFBE01020286.1/.p1  ORF type:complete len:355 (+),score=88.94 gb/GFBE01020286.1/:1-1065(+)
MSAVKRFAACEHKAFSNELRLFSIDTTVPASSEDARLAFESSCSGTATPAIDTSETVIFFDWDDTLFPTTEIFDHWGFQSQEGSALDVEEPELDAQQKQMLKNWKESLQRLLKAAMELSGHCAIVTNAQPAWVESCLRRFAPDLLPLFSEPGGPEVVYARQVLKDLRRKKKVRDQDSLNPVKYPNSYEDEEERNRLQCSEMATAKYEAMQQELNQFFGGRPGSLCRNIISFGDMEYEHEAVQELGMRNPSHDQEIRIKSLLLPEAPMVSELALRLDLLRLLLPVCVRVDTDVNVDLKDLRSESALQKLSKALKLPALCNVDFPVHAWGIGPKPAQSQVSDGLVNVAAALQMSRL